MQLLKSIMGRSPKAATDFEVVIAKISEEIADLEGRRALLRVALQAAPFESESPEEVETIRARLRQVTDDLEFAKGTLDEAERRRAAAAEDEAAAAIVARMEAAKDDQRALKAAYVAYHDAATELVRQVSAIRALRTKLLEANAEALKAGRKDLRLVDPFAMLGQIVPHAHNEPGRDGALTILDYWPAPHPDGPPLAHIGKVKL